MVLVWQPQSCAPSRNLFTRRLLCKQGDDYDADDRDYPQKCATICLLCPGLLRTRWRNSAIRVKPGAGWIASMVRHWACHHSPDKIIIISSIHHFHLLSLPTYHWMVISIIQRHCDPMTSSSSRTLCQCNNHVHKSGVSYHWPLNHPILLQSLIFNNMANLVLVLLTDQNLPFSCLNSVFQYDKPCCTDTVTENCENMDQSCAWKQTCK